MLNINEVQNFFRFRNATEVGPVIIQCFMILSAALILLGLIYVCFLVIIITIHHCLFDKNAAKVPDYVKKSFQFSSTDSDESDDDNAKKRNSASSEVRTVLSRIRRSERISIDDDEYDSPAAVFRKSANVRKNLSQGAQRMNNLDKFMGVNIDVKRN